LSSDAKRKGERGEEKGFVDRGLKDEGGGEAAYGTPGGVSYATGEGGPGFRKSLLGAGKERERELPASVGQTERGKREVARPTYHSSDEKVFIRHCIEKKRFLGEV